MNFEKFDSLAIIIAALRNKFMWLWKLQLSKAKTLFLINVKSILKLIYPVSIYILGSKPKYPVLHYPKNDLNSICCIKINQGHAIR